MQKVSGGKEMTEICKCVHPKEAHLNYGKGRCQRLFCECKKFHEAKEK